MGTQQEDLKTLIEKWNGGDIEKLDSLKRSQVFLEVYKDLAVIMKRDFDTRMTTDIVEITLLDKDPRKENVNPNGQN
jgi:hypothetical protein